MTPADTRDSRDRFPWLGRALMLLILGVSCYGVFLRPI